MLSRLVLLWLGLSLVNVAAGANGLLGQYWPAYGTQKPQAVDWSRTDIGYYFVSETDATGFNIPKGQSISALKTFVSTAHSKRKKAVFTIGGWTGSRYFSDRVATSGNRTKLVAAIREFLVKYDFDGVDLDWEYPGSQGIGCNKVRATDSDNFLLFLKSLRATLGSKKLITAAIGASGLIGADGNPLTDMKAFGAVFDIINLMTYDVGGPWSPTSGPNCPLRTCNSDTSVMQVVQAFKKAGIPASKMMLGIPAYGYSYQLKSSTLASKRIDGYVSRVYQAKTSTTPKGSKTDSNATSTDVCGVRSASYSGMWNYVNLISEGILSSNGSVGHMGFTRYVDSCSATPFLFNPRTKVMINYDDAYSAGQKTAYAMSQGLKGVYTFDSAGFNTAVLKSIRNKLDA
ncbi:hypothetical protein MVLG_00887 [Microbotryum lychnidis-dioicae p1A1 Lamole]|uniref:GH18 domain-containing protein n=1 Tax=Microbotryum lychnidis-dioicae (strain p1A1 Lamole / MvSl-1064) TaxID=683840 RepID=U5H0F4_USTV1|nr:hypothetical protein MVLG_00887 [Microbotryum lychnidis-dioicae p1A1 Lamole]|eukprot:KDE08781.1 hypothetical protein MVLG_00887 [Microbotryum lychnidis-dioicae p1A1 Lamole]